MDEQAFVEACQKMENGLLESLNKDAMSENQYVRLTSYKVVFTASQRSGPTLVETATIQRRMY